MARAAPLSATRADRLMASIWPLTGIASEHYDLRVSPAIKPAERALLTLLGRRIVGRAARVIGVSRGVAEGVRVCPRLDPAKTRVINNPLRPRTPETEGIDDQRLFDCWTETGPRLLTVGALKPPKAHDVLLRVLAALARHSDARLIILGEGPLRPSSESLADPPDSERLKRRAADFTVAAAADADLEEMSGPPRCPRSAAGPS